MIEISHPLDVNKLEVVELDRIVLKEFMTSLRAKFETPGTWVQYENPIHNSVYTMLAVDRPQVPIAEISGFTLQVYVLPMKITHLLKALKVIKNIRKYTATTFDINHSGYIGVLFSIGRRAIYRG
jgi:hypothetical protein